MTVDPFEYDPVARPPVDDDGLEDTVAEVELDGSLDRVEDDDPAVRGGVPASAVAVLDDDSLGYDPEAGQVRIADKSSVAGQIMSEAGLFVIGLCAAMLGLSVLIYAVTVQSTPSLIAAGVIAPPTLCWAFFKWRRWMGGAPYAYRLLMSLNEKEAADEALQKRRAKEKARVEKRIAELEKRGVRVEE